MRRRLCPPLRQSFAHITAELYIHLVTLYNWRKFSRLQGEVVPASEKDLDWQRSAAKFTGLFETAGLSATERSDYCRERGLHPE